MSSAGHIMDMINRQKNNDLMRTSNRYALRKERKDNAYFGKAKDPNFLRNTKQVPPEELERIKQKIRKDAKSRRNLRYLVFFVSLVVFGSTIALGFHFFLTELNREHLNFLF